MGSNDDGPTNQRRPIEICVCRFTVVMNTDSLKHGSLYEMFEIINFE